jgi:hypothetical protein
MAERDTACAALEDAIAGAYAAFTRYPPPQKMRTRWGTTVDREELRPLTVKSLDQLGWNELQRYVYKGRSLWGDADDYRHFLPRLPELLATNPPDAGEAINEAIILYNIGDVWRTWPADEREAVERYLVALWRYVLCAFDPAKAASFPQDALCCIAQVSGDLAPYLVTWADVGSAGSAASLVYLAHYLNANSRTLVQGMGLDNSYWSERRAQMRQVVDWLLGPRPVALLEAGYLAHAGEPFAVEFAQTADALYTLRGGPTADEARDETSGS